MQDYYTKNFYKFIGEYSQKSAEEIVPLVLKLIPCNQVIDVGCGDGTWLKAFKKYGVEEILGVDGDYVDEDTLVIPKEKFVSFDLKKPLKIKKQFDLVVSLEVAEHLPADCAEIFIDSLTSLGPVILFSAAIPYQGGVNHINEQWPDYWVSLFQEKNYVLIDCVRKKIWNNSNVAYWYKQNILIFVERSYLETNSYLKSEFEKFENTDNSLLSVVHPTAYLDTKIELLNTKLKLTEEIDPEKLSLRKTLGVLPKLITNAFKRRIKLLQEQIIEFVPSILEFYIRPLILATTIKHIFGLKKIDYAINELIVICVVRNGELHIKSFIEHYFLLGVKHIVFLDNGSTDDTIAIARKYDKVTIFQTKCPYQKYETVMKRYLVKRFSTNRWNLFSDIDELFDYPFSDVLSLSSLLTYLNNNSYTAVVTQMLDLFSDKNLAALKSQKDDSLKEIYIYYDISNIEKESYPYGAASNKDVKWHWGGVRKTLFGTNNYLTKAALIFVDKKISIFIDCHHVNNAYIADFTCVLLHYPFVSSFYEKVVDAVKTDRYAMSASHEYEMYWERLKQEPDINIKQETACKLKNVNCLLESDFLVVSEDYMRWVKTHSKNNYK